MKRFRFFSAAALSFALLLASSSVANSQSLPRTPPTWAANPFYDIVAVGLRPGEIVLATPAFPRGGKHWRFRRISAVGKVERAAVSLSATQLLVFFSSGAQRHFDLTLPLVSINERDVPSLKHHLPPGLFTVGYPSTTCSDEASCEAAARGAMQQGGLAFTHDAETRLGRLIHQLLKESPGNSQWQFFPVRPEVSLYAPILEFAPNEPAYPSDVNIWELILPRAKGNTREDYQAAYDSLGPERFSRCSVYYRAISYPGSWLIEFWYYYPFDEGKPHRHIHDSEHVFIEVDKLGGRVINYIASDHGSFAPNNGYSTLLTGAKPITLPLFAMVEFEKHAMAPDLDGNGTFTRGVDENMYPLHYEAWGVRDIATQPQHLMKPYKPSMTLPRKFDDRLAMRDAPNYYSDIAVPQGRCLCGLIPLPDELPEAPKPEKQANPVPTAQAGMAHLLDHPDALHPTAIYKPWVLPYRQLRLGMALFDHNGNHDQLYAAYAMDIPHLTHNALPIPFRIAFETMWSPSSHRASLISGGQTLGGTISSEMYLGTRFEGFYSHTQGYYFGVTPQIRRFTTETINGIGVPHSVAWQYEGVWYRAGYMFELPSRVHGNMTHHVGVIFHGSTVRIEWRVSFGVLRQRGRDHFGLSPSQPSQ